MWWILLASLALSGRYEGASTAGRVWLELRPDGTAEYGGAPWRWRQDGNVLELAPEADGDALRLEIEAVAIGAAGSPPRLRLVGPPFGVVWLRAVPSLNPEAPAAKPESKVHPQWVGRWRHLAVGGELIVELGADATYAMIERPEARVTRGRWTADNDWIELQPDGGTPLRYCVRRVAERLFVSGGDLPTEVAFEHHPQ